ncbi:hypothetical protein BRC93_08575 [Halobacteriales archaeon QS_5_70_15]|nr:MAG: hypothetical protein BRC93_08575 [Halobacteriales archaeon QS_5_70_15]
MTRDRRRPNTADERGQTTLDFALGVSVFLLTAIFVLTFVPGMLEPFEESTQEELSAADRIATDLIEETLASPDRPHLLDRECTVIFFESREDGFDPGGDDAENVDGDGTYAEPFGTGTYAGDCNFQDISFEDRLALSSSTGADLNVRVRLVRDLTTASADDPDNGTDDDRVLPLCIDDNSEDRIIEGHTPFDGGQCDLRTASADDDVLFEIGSTPPSGSDSVLAARRFVRMEGEFHDGTNDATLVVEVW